MPRVLALHGESFLSRFSNFQLCKTYISTRKVIASRPTATQLRYIESIAKIYYGDKWMKRKIKLGIALETDNR